MTKMNEDGFTLIETVLTVFIISLTLLIPALSIDEMIENTQIEMFFRELTADITLMQNHTILTGEGTNIDFRRSNGVDRIRYSVRLQPDHPLNKTVVIDPEIGGFRNAVPTLIEYNVSSGNISNFGTIDFVMSNGTYRLTFWLGSARFEIEKRN